MTELFKKWLMTSVLLCSSAFVHAEETATQALRTALQQLKSYEAIFSQTVTDAQGEVLQQSQGNISLKQPNLMRWEVVEPDENLLIADGQTLWMVDPFVEQATALDQQQAIENNPIILLTDPDNARWQDFDVVRNGETFEIVSKSDESAIASLILTFEASRLIAIAFKDRQQTLSELTFSDIRLNRPLSQETFTFSLPPGFDFDDQRTP